MLTLMALLIAGMMVLAIATLNLQQATGKVLTPYHGLDYLRSRLNRQVDPAARGNKSHDRSAK